MGKGERKHVVFRGGAKAPEQKCEDANARGGDTTIPSSPSQLRIIFFAPSLSPFNVYVWELFNV